jgi:G3E family GTPase
MLHNKVAVTIVSGFLGAGKTTLVNHLLQAAPSSGIGVIVNEYGEVGVDGDLIVASERPVLEIRNGCICCTVRTDLVAAVKDLLGREDLALERLIIETSGLADPAPVLQSFLADADLLESTELESVVCVIDAVHFHAQIGNPIADEQLAFADLILLNKLDQVEWSDILVIEQTIKRMNPTAAIVRAVRSVVPVDTVLGQRRFDLPNLLEIEPALLTDAHDHEHDASIVSCCVEADTALDPGLFNAWIGELVAARSADLLRMKGILRFAGEARPFIFHGVHMLLECRPGRLAQDGLPRTSRLVLIGRNLDQPVLQQALLRCCAAHSLAAA